MDLNEKNFKKIRKWYWGTGFKVTYLILILGFVAAIIANIISNYPKVKKENEKWKYLYDSTKQTYVAEMDDGSIFLIKDNKGNSYNRYSIASISPYLNIYASNKGYSLSTYAKKLKYTNYFRVETYSNGSYSLQDQGYSFKDGSKEYIFEDLYFSYDEINVEFEDDYIWVENTATSESQLGIIISSVESKRVLLPIETSSSIAFISATNVVDDVINMISRMELYFFVAIIVVLLVLAIISIKKRRIYAFVISLLLLIERIFILAAFFVFKSLKIGNGVLSYGTFPEFSTYIGINYFFVILTIGSILFVLTFLFRVGRRYPKGILGSKEYYEKLGKLNGADKKQFIIDVQTALKTNDINKFKTLLGFEAEANNEEENVDDNYTDTNDNYDQNEDNTETVESNQEETPTQAAGGFTLSSLAPKEEEKVEVKDTENVFELDPEEKAPTPSAPVEEKTEVIDNTEEKEEPKEKDESDDDKNDSNNPNSGSGGEKSDKDKQISKDLNTSFSRLAELLNKK